MILLDDSDARDKARLYDLKITGTVGILLGAKRIGTLGSLKDALADLSRTGFWLRQSLRERILREAGE